MHIVFGGAYNGKRQYVLAQLANESYEEYSGEIPSEACKTVIISNFEQLVMKYRQMDELEVAQTIVGQIKALSKQVTVICICNDIGRGIVPMDRDERFIRDACGRVYQALFKEAESIVRIWYGLAERIK